MKVFALTELTRKWSELKHAAARAPVTLTDYNKPRFVLMAIEDYEKLLARAGESQLAFKLRDAPPELADLIAKGLAENIAEASDD